MIVLSIANSVDPDEMPPYAAFHLGLHCLPKYLFTSNLNKNGKPFVCWVILKAFLSSDISKMAFSKEVFLEYHQSVKFLLLLLLS